MKIRKDRIWQTFTLAVDNDDDMRLLAWLDSLAVSGNKSQAIRDALLKAMPTEAAPDIDAGIDGPFDEVIADGDQREHFADA